MPDPVVPPVIKDPATYAKFPAGTRVSWGPLGTTLEKAALLQSAMSLGTIGQKGSFLKVSRLIDTSPKYIGDMGEGEDLTFTFIDDTSDKDQMAFMASAVKKEAAVMFIEYPNKEVANLTLALAGFARQAIDGPDGKILQVEVYAKQNDIKWTTNA
ncbi:phage tail protein [Serratia marcescens]|uniref:phage tail protein n=1 Tax=Serratia marcescens TaxID=615 RepID=UPI001570A215|nr:phage tail protein [Serratia marcescens]NSL16653.1 phage tail protein [Serratia marcescens]